MSVTTLVAFGIPIGLALVAAALAAGRGRRAWLWFGLAFGAMGLGVAIPVELGATAAVLGGALGWVATLSLLLSLPSRAFRLERVAGGASLRAAVSAA